MLLSNYLIITALLIILDVIVQKWYKKDGQDYKKDKRALTPFSITRGCIYVAILYISAMSWFLGHKLDTDIPEQGTTVYVYPDEDMKYNYFTSDFINDFIGNPSEITEETYFDKIKIAVSRKTMNVVSYLKNVIIAPFNIDYYDFFTIEATYVQSTGACPISGVATVEENKITVEDTVLQLNDYTRGINTGDYVEGIVIFDNESVNEGVITKYIIVEENYNE